VNFYPTERTILLIDGPDLHGICRSLEIEIDFKKLLQFFQRRTHLVRALYYTTIVVQDQHAAIRPLVDWLEYNGFTLVTKPAKVTTDEHGRRRVSSNMRVEMAVDAMDLADKADHVVLFTGDNCFRHLLEALQRRGKRVSIVSTLERDALTVADELRRQADQFIDFLDLEPHVSRPVRQTPIPPSAERRLETQADAAFQSERLPRNPGAAAPANHETTKAGPTADKPSRGRPKSKE
jgi:uncharacterized LabA/DUF88 family protein